MPASMHSDKGYPGIEKGKPSSTHARALGGSKRDVANATEISAAIHKQPRSNDPRTIARRAEKNLVSDCSVPELVDVLISRGRRSNGFSSLTTKQRLDLIAHLIAR